MPILSRLFGALVVLMGLAFVFSGGVKLVNPGQVRGLFASWGLTATWTITFAGVVEFVLGALLVWSRTRLVAGVAMMLWMAFFGFLQIRAGQVGGATASAIVFLVSLGAVLMHRKAQPE